MSRQVLPHEVAALTARLPCWLPGAVNWSVKLACHGPPWLPLRLRRTPLEGCALLMRLYHWRASR